MRLLDLVRYVWAHPLNANGKLGALVRVLRWQVGSRLLPGPVALPYVGSTRLFAARGMTGATGNWYCGLHEHCEMAFVLHMLRESDHFIDVGANVGSYTVLASGVVGARTTSVEPIPDTFGYLSRNVALNDLNGRVRCWQGGLSDHPGVLRFTSGLDTVNHVLATGEDLPSVEVPVTTLDELVAGDPPALIKIDVEGHERAVLQGAQRTLADPRLLAVVMETNGSGARYGVSDNDLVVAMRNHGFSMYGYEPFSRRLAPGQPTGGNTVFVRDLKAVTDRVRSAPRFTLINGSI
jgi:FkbM family methyltransferase